ncbi:3-hydroxyacyl-CoA dehydrogenase NAD-binding domain-containing protein [Brucella anthropi]|uniref:3-hydroxyacyl-CoA dehydrogenase NAD-binding domain-containing protein n=1 Tax=Brucella anthropi TaxID=529 RepID=UPI002101CBEB|nr:3-hydroxyacyl-CoA dehydrogenase NAD-binding domain-containing protein [Brucella anthropi]
MTIATVTVLGTGILGAQIALQAAWHGFSVIAYDIDEAALAKGRGLVDAFALRLAGRYSWRGRGLGRGREGAHRLDGRS